MIARFIYEGYKCMLPRFGCGARCVAVAIESQQSVESCLVGKQQREEFVDELVVSRRFTLFKTL